MLKIASDRATGLEVWAKWSNTAEVYELFASEAADDYIGCVDTLAEARRFAKDSFAEEAANR